MSDHWDASDHESATVLTVVQRLNDAVNHHDVDAVMALMTDDCVFENTFPPPSGTRFEGGAAVRSFWEQFFAAGHNQEFELEEIFACGDRCVTRWIYRWTDADGKAGHIRGVDIFRVRDGKVAEKLSYVKG